MMTPTPLLEALGRRCHNEPQLNSDGNKTIYQLLKLTPKAGQKPKIILIQTAKKKISLLKLGKSRPEAKNISKPGLTKTRVSF